MPSKPFTDALDWVRRKAVAQPGADLSDAALLDRFTTAHDERAFAVLVERHGALVYGVCSRLLRVLQDVEDACQATFLVLARKAAGVRKQASLASWLHGVARRVSLTLLREQRERRVREQQRGSSETITAPPDSTWSEVQILLDEELERLPERYRSPLILCYLEGKTREETAAVLGTTPGQLHGLLQRGRDLLRDRLVKRGVENGVFGAALEGGTRQPLSPTLSMQIVNGAVVSFTGQSLAPPVVGTQVIVLTNEVIRVMFTTKIKMAALWTACVGILCTLIGGAALKTGFAQSGEKSSLKSDERKPASSLEPKVPGKEKVKGLQLNDLKDDEYTFKITSLVRHPKVSFPGSAISDTEYTTTKDEKDRRIRFSDKGKQLTLLPEKVTGTLQKTTDDERIYRLSEGLFAGGSLTLKQTKNGLIATYTVYGSGVPIIVSYKGRLLKPDVAQTKKSVPTFRKVMTAPSETKNDFKHAVLAVSNEQKALFSRNYIVTGGENVQSSGLHLWTLTPGKHKRTKVGDGTQFGFIPNSSTAYFVSWGRGVLLWDTRTHTKIGDPIPHELREDSTLNPAVSPGGEVMVTRSQLDHLQFWDLRTRKPITPEIKQEGMVGGMAFSSDGKWFFSQTERGKLTVWDPKTGKLAAGPLRHDIYISGNIYSPITQQLVTFQNNAQKEDEWRSEAVIRSGKEWSDIKRVEISGHAREGYRLDDSHLLVVADKKQPGRKPPFSYGKKLVYLVSKISDKPVIQTVLQTVWIRDVAIAPDRKHFLTRTFQTTSCWKLGEEKPVWTKPGDQIVSFGDREWVLLQEKDSAVVCSLADGKELWRKDQVIASRVQGSKLWLFGETGVEVWEVGDKKDR